MDGFNEPELEVIEKAKALVLALDEITASADYASVWICADMHGAKYRGRQWTRELNELRESIKKLEGANQ